MIDDKNIIVEGDVISLRILNQRDAIGSWWEWFNDKEVTRYMNKGYEENTPQKQSDFLKKMKLSNKDCVLGIFYNKNNKHIGTTAIHNMRNELGTKKGNFGIIIGEKFFWGKGIGAEAWQMMVKYAFNELGLDVIETMIFSSNEASLKVAKKIGFEHKEIKINDLEKNGEMIDRIIFRLEKDHWKKKWLKK